MSFFIASQVKKISVRICPPPIPSSVESKAATQPSHMATVSSLPVAKARVAIRYPGYWD